MTHSITTKEFSAEVRRLSVEMVHRAKASHIGSALSIADIVSVLYCDIMRTNPAEPSSSDRDRLILSKGHACVAIYAALCVKGYISKDDLETYGQDFSKLMNHISHKVPGVEFSTGSLGHGLPFAAGKALFAKSTQKTWHNYVIMSDGELDEGSNWEAFLFAAHHQLDNLTAIIDYNKLQSLTSVQDTLALEPLAEKLQAFNWHVVETDGHDIQALTNALMNKRRGSPQAIIAHTVKGKGVSFMERQVSWHYKSPSEEELQQAIRELSIAQ